VTPTILIHRTYPQFQLPIHKMQSPTANAEPLIEERPIVDAAALAERLIAEAQRCWYSSGWTLICAKNGVRVEAKNVAGVFAASGVKLTRSSGEIATEAQPVFDRLVSLQGYALIDLFSDPHDHLKPPLESIRDNPALGWMQPWRSLVCPLCAPANLWS
jgi:hypothetical protein